MSKRERERERERDRERERGREREREREFIRNETQSRGYIMIDILEEFE